MKRCWSALVLAIVTVSSVHAQQEATALIREVADVLKNSTSFHFESVTDSELNASLHRSWSRTREVLIRQIVSRDGRPQVRFEAIDNSGSFIVVSDGKTLWRAAPDTREFTRTVLSEALFNTKGGGPVAEAALQRLRSAMGYVERLGEDLSKAEQVGKEMLEVDGKRVECVVVHAEYTPPKGTIGIDSWTRSLWIDAQRKVLLKDESVTRGRLFPSRPFEDVESRHTSRYVVASIGERIPAYQFVYGPPRNFRETDRLERPFPRAANDLIGKAAPELSMQTLSGETVKLADLRGKIVLLDFWATWCEPCRKQMPAIAKLHQETRDQDVVLLGVNDDETPEQALKFADEQGYGWSSLFDGRQKDARTKFKVSAIPALVLIDREGIIAYYQIGAGEDADASIRSALKKLGVTLR